VKLQRLIIQGFKSFRDRTTIHFDNGITGIVGPNGCGKSNIVDALFWVMGEMSAKHLRGNSMKDVIFAGSSKFPPGSFAEATLVLENTEGKHIHIGNKVSSPSEIQLTRKLYRNGDTEYRINGQPCRLKDIQEVFMDTGAGAKSYSIIAQGEINRLVQAKPEERRVMIEEVAGITKFKLRKRESLRKIEQTQQNLNRLTDLQQEIEKNLASLRKQAEKAERARTLKEKIRRNDLVVHSHKVFDALKNFRDANVLINEKTLDVEGWKTRKNSLEVSLVDERLKKDQLTERIEEQQKSYNEISKKLAAAEERLNSLCQNQTDKEGQIETRNREVIELQEELSERLIKSDALKAEFAELEEQSKEENNFDDWEEKVEILKTGLENTTDSVSSLRSDLEENRNKLSQADQVIFKNNSRFEEYAASLQDLTTEIETLENQYSTVSTQIADEREAVHAAEKAASDLVFSEQELRAKLETAKQEYKTTDQTLSEKGRDLIKAESKLSSLIEINKSLEGVTEGATEFVGAHEDQGYGLLGSFLNCEEKYSKAVQQILAEYMESLVSENDDDSLFANWLSENGEKGLDYLSPNQFTEYGPETIERLKVCGFEAALPLNEIIQIPVGLQDKLKSFMAGYFVLPGLTTENYRKLSGEIRFKAAISEDGQVLVRNVGGATVLSVASKLDTAQGIVERNNLIAELEVEVATLKVFIAELDEKIGPLDESRESLANEHDAIRDQLADGKADFAAKKSALDSKLANFETGNARLEILKNRKNTISKSRLELMENEEELQNNQAKLKELVEEIAEKLEIGQEALETQQQTYNEEKEALLEKQVAAKSFNQRLESLTGQIEDIEKQSERQKTRIASGGELIARLSQEITVIESELECLEKQNGETVEDLKVKELALSEVKDLLVELLRAMQVREDEVKKINTDVNKSEKIIAENSGKLGAFLAEEENVVRDIFEKYRIDLRDVLGSFLEFEERDLEKLNDLSGMYLMETENGPMEIVKEAYEFNRRYGQDLKDCSGKLKSYKNEYNRLGEINWQAIEDFERQKLRFDFLNVQEKELKESLEDLEKAINHIDGKSKERFKIAFEEVNDRFAKVFPIIFGGGNARLALKGDINDPESGVDIIAQPPGKKMQNINLMSGGEKALTAVSLIFSIFLVKPSPFCLLDEVDAPLDDANVGRFNELLREMSGDSQFILITHNKKTMELNDTLYGVTMQEPGISKAVSVQLH
jgi:chromosome segregation protein